MAQSFIVTCGVSIFPIVNLFCKQEVENMLQTMYSQFLELNVADFFLDVCVIECQTFVIYVSIYL